MNTLVINQNDVNWMDLYDTLNSHFFTFKEVKNLIGLDALFVKTINNELFDKIHEKLWMEQINKIKTNKLSPVSGMVTSAIYIVTLPFELLQDNHLFSNEELEIINWCKLYYCMPLIPWKRAPIVTHMEYHAFSHLLNEWIEHQHTKCMLLIIYNCYLKLKNKN